jgi:hypothetical protein
MPGKVALNLKNLPCSDTSLAGWAAEEPDA